MTDDYPNPTLLVRDATYGGGPGAFEGEEYCQYLSSGSLKYGDATFAEQTSGTIKLDLALYTQSRSDSRYSFYIWLMDANDNVAYRLSNDANWLIDNAGAGAFTSLGTWVRDRWNVVGVDYTLGSNEVTFRMNGLSQTKTTANSISSATKIRFKTGNAPQTYYFDAVPEPATMLALALGAGLALLRRSR